MTVFDKCIAVILRNEGGYVNHPSDPGGETKYGVTDRRDGRVDGMVDIDGDGTGDVFVRDLTPEQAKVIYKREYWDKTNLDMLRHPDLVLQVFDMAINAGPRTAVIILQLLVGVSADGKLGPVTANAINRIRDQYSLADKYADERIKYYMKLASNKPKLKVFLQGWINRVSHTKF